MRKPAPSLVGSLLALFAVFLLSGCASHKAFVAGEDMMTQGRYDEAVRQYYIAATGSPDTDEYQVRLANARAKAAWQHLQTARDLSAKDDFKAAAAELRVAMGFDPTLEVAKQELRQVEDRIQAGLLLDEAEDFYRQRRYEQAKNDLQKVLGLDAENRRAKELLVKVQSAEGTIFDGQELDVASTKPITLKFKEAKIKEVFGILSRLSGINFLFDEDTKDQKITVFLEKATFSQALELLLKMNNLGKRVLNPKTVIIYSDTKDKEKQYQDQLIQTFYLSNIDAKKAVNLLRTMLQLRKIYVHEELNAIVIRDTPDVIRLAQQILEAADRASAEVVYELELVEVSHTNDLNIGPRLQSYGTTFGYVNPDSTTIDKTVTVSGLSKLQFLYTIPTATFNLEKTLTDSEILANPKIRVRNHEKAKVHVGSREPVITVTTTGTDTRSDSIQYVDVGVKLEIEPTVQLDNTVVTKVGLEVSNVTGRETTENGTSALTISTTNANTALTLKDGETTILGGLIRDDYSKTQDTFPLLDKIPLIGDLISGHQRNKSKREILLSITPHIVRSLDLPRPDVASIWSGGEDDLKAGPNFSAFAQPLEAEQNKPAPTPVPGQLAPDQSPGVTPGLMPAEPPAATPPAEVPQAPGAQAVPVPEVAPALVPATVETTQTTVPAPPTPVPAPTAEAESQPAAAAPANTAGVPTVALAPREVPAVQGPAKIFLRGPVLVKAGEEFTIEVAVDSLHNLYSAPFFLAFPPQLCRFVRAEEGPFLAGGGEPTVFTSSVDQDKGQLLIGNMWKTAGPGTSGSGVLARVTLQAKAPGKGMLSLNRVNFRDPAGGLLHVATEGLPIEVQ